MKWTPYLLLLFLIVGMFLSTNPVTVQASYTPRYKLKLDVVGRNIIFASESISFLPTTNFTQVMVRVYDPSSRMVYESYKPSNVSFSYTPNSTYGSYTVKAFIGNQSASARFYLQRIDSLYPIAVPYTWSFKGITYRLLLNYTLQAELNGKKLNMDWLSEIFTKLKPVVTLYKNDYGLVYIGTVGKDIDAETWIMDTDFGLKMRINGTLAKATALKWNYKAFGGEILWTDYDLKLSTETPLGSFIGRKDYLVFDFLDMFSSASYGVNCIVDKTGQKLNVYLSTSFDVDPAVRVQGNARGTSKTSTTISATMSASPTSGNLLIATIVVNYDASVDPLTISSITQTNVAWTEQVTVRYTADGNYFRASIWAGVVSASAGTGVVVTLSANDDYGGVVDVCEYSGLLTSGFLDKTASSGGSGTATSTGTTATTTQASELWVGVIGTDNQAQATPTNSFTLLDGARIDYTSNAYLEKIVSSTGTASSGTTITSSYWWGCIATFKAVGGTNYEIAVSLSATLSKSVSIAWSSLVGVSKSFTLAKSVSVAWDSFVGVSQSIGLSRTIDVAWSAIVDISGSLGLSEAVSVGWEAVVGLSQSLGLDTSVNILKGFAVELNQSIGLAFEVTINWIANVFPSLNPMFSWVASAFGSTGVDYASKGFVFAVMMVVALVVIPIFLIGLLVMRRG